MRKRTVAALVALGLVLGAGGGLRPAPALAAEQPSFMQKNSYVEEVRAKYPHKLRKVHTQTLLVIGTRVCAALNADLDAKLVTKTIKQQYKQIGVHKPKRAAHYTMVHAVANLCDDNLVKVQ